jgi:hypothetical protein
VAIAPADGAELLHAAPAAPGTVARLVGWDREVLPSSYRYKQFSSFLFFPQNFHLLRLLSVTKRAFIELRKTDLESYNLFDVITVRAHYVEGSKRFEE